MVQVNKVNKTKEIVVELDNKPGTFAQVSEALGKKNVNIMGFELQAHGKVGTARFVTSDPAKALDAIKGLGLKPTSREVVTVAAPNKPGELARLTKRLADSGVNIEAAFPTLAETGGEAQVAFCCDDIASATKALQG